MLIERRLGMKKFERIPFVLGQWIEAKGYCVPGVTIKILAEQVGVNSNCLSNTSITPLELHSRSGFTPSVLKTPSGSSLRILQ